MARDIVPELPARLVELREARGLSQSELAALSGTSVFSVSKLERGERSPSFRLALCLADALGVPADALREPKGSPDPWQKKFRKK